VDYRGWVETVESFYHTAVGQEGEELAGVEVPDAHVRRRWHAAVGRWLGQGLGRGRHGGEEGRRGREERKGEGK
jgi:hypothetical protein